MITATNLTKQYGTITAIEDVTFSIDQGEVIGFLGPNGAGKTTTMRILTGFMPPTSGTATIAGFDVSDDALAVKQRIGYLPENVPLYGEMTVTKFLEYVAEVKGVTGKNRKTEALRVMDRCGLSHMAKRVIGHLSKGYRQRVGLAQALLGNPPVLILDEPTVGLDPKQIIDIRQMIKELSQDHTVLLSTHILPEVTMVCERVLIINDGRIVAQDTMANLAAKDGRRLEIETGGDPKKVTSVLSDASGVTEVTATGPDRYIVTCEPGTDARAAVAKVLVDAGFSLRRLEELSRTLEDVFVQVISKEETAENGEAEGAA